MDADAAPSRGQGDGGGAGRDEWRRERERAYADILAEVASLRREAGLVQRVLDVGAQVERAGSSEAPPAAAGTPHGAGEGGEAEDDVAESVDGARGALADALLGVPGGGPGTVREEPVPAVVPRVADQPPENPRPPARWGAFGPGALHQRASHARTWCAKLGTAVMMQGVVQFLTGRVCLEEVALWRMQTAACAWHPGAWVDDTLDTQDRGAGAGLGAAQASDDSHGAQSPGGSHARRFLEWLAGGGSHDWVFAPPDAATVNARRDWSQDLDDEAFETVAASSFIWNRALRPIVSIGMAQLLCTHCPKALWGKVLMVALPFLRHPLKVISLRIVCPGWPPPPFWHLILLTLDSSTKTSLLSGIIPKFCSHLLVQQLRSYDLHGRIRALLTRMRLFAPVTPAGGARQAEGERGAARPEVAAGQGDEAEEGERAARGAGGAQRAREREEQRRRTWIVCEPLQRVLAAMIEDLMLATVTYPLVVLERRMSVDVSCVCCSWYVFAREFRVRYGVCRQRSVD